MGATRIKDGEHEVIIEDDDGESDYDEDEDDHDKSDDDKEEDDDGKLDDDELGDPPDLLPQTHASKTGLGKYLFILFWCFSVLGAYLTLSASNGDQYLSTPQAGEISPRQDHNKDLPVQRARPLAQKNPQK